MAGRGPAPKPAEKRLSRHKDEHPQVELGQPLAQGAAPKLPNERSYSPRTRAWYRTWARSPQAAQFMATDWQRLQMLAPLVEQYYEVPSSSLFAEIRRCEAGLGCTPEDRLRLRWRLGAQRAAEDRAPERAGSSTAARPARQGDPRLRLAASQ